MAGWITDTAALLATTLANCHALQTWGGNDWTAAEALARIYHHALPVPAGGLEHTLAELQAYRPFVLIWTEQGDGLEIVRDTAGPDWAPQSRGHLVACLEQSTPADLVNDPSAAERDFESMIGRLMGSGNPDQPGLYELSGRPQYLPITRIAYRGIARTANEDVTEIGDAQRAWLDIHWQQG